MGNWKHSDSLKVLTVSIGSDRFTISTSKMMVEFIDEIICNKFHLYPSRSAFVRIAIWDRIKKDSERLTSMLGIIDNSKMIKSLPEDIVMVPKKDERFDYHKLVLNKNHANKGLE